jgi:hypothetical protein
MMNADRNQQAAGMTSDAVARLIGNLQMENASLQAEIQLLRAELAEARANQVVFDTKADKVG